MLVPPPASTTWVPAARATVLSSAPRVMVLEPEPAVITPLIDPEWESNVERLLKEDAAPTAYLGVDGASSDFASIICSCMARRAPAESFCWIAA